MKPVIGACEEAKVKEKIWRNRPISLIQLVKWLSTKLDIRILQHNWHWQLRPRIEPQLLLPTTVVDVAVNHLYTGEESLQLAAEKR